MADSGTGDTGPHPSPAPSNVIRLTGRNKSASPGGLQGSDDHSDVPFLSAVTDSTPTPRPKISRAFVMNGGNGSGSNSSPVQHALRAVIIAMAFNLLIATSKLLVALYVTRSAALFSEGLHSTADSFNSITLLVGIMQGKKAPDRTHPYGYGLETNFWALMASMVLFISSLSSLWMGWRQLMTPEPLTHLGWAMGLLLISVIFEIGALTSASQAVLADVGVEGQGPLRMFSLAWRHVGKVQSPTTRFVFYEDLVALLGALIALIALGLGLLASQNHWIDPALAHVPDAVASMLIGLMLLGLSINLFRYNRTFLTGAAASESVEKAIHRLVNATHGVSSIVDLRTIDQGISGLFIQMKIQVNPDIPVRDVDDLIDHVKERLVANLRNVKDVFVEVIADESDEEWSVTFHRLIEEGLAKDVIQPREAAILKNVVDFTESTAQEVMIPRTDVVSVEVKTPLSDVATQIIESRHSKIPVYRERTDKLIGIVYARDVFACILRGEPDTPLESLVKEIDIYPENKPVGDLLEEFKREKMQMAAVLDEHGGFAGIVTAADLMGELVGDDLWDDEDGVETEQEIQRLDEASLLVSGRTDIYDLNEQFGLSIPEDEFQTVGGFVFGLLGREPEDGDEVRFEDLTFRVNETDGPRIKTIVIRSESALASVSPESVGESH